MNEKINNRRDRKRNDILILLIVILVVFLSIMITYYLINWVNVKAPSTQKSPYGHSVFCGIINESEDFWNITVIEIDEHFDDDIKYFYYSLSFKYENSRDNFYYENQSFFDLKNNNSKYIDYIDNDFNDRVTKDDEIIINKYYNTSKELIIEIHLTYFNENIDQGYGQGFISLSEINIGTYLKPLPA